MKDNDMITISRCRGMERADGLHMKTVLGYTFPDFVDAISSRYGDRVCYRIYGSDTAFTFNQVRDYSESISARLLSLGIGKGDNVAIIGESSPMWMIMYLGIVSIGAVAIPILPDFPQCDVESIISLCCVKGIAASRKCMQKTEGMEGIPRFRLDDLMELKDGQEDDGLPLIGHEADPYELMIRRPKEEDIASIIFTSGTTGSSKGVMLTHMNLLRTADLSTDVYVRLRPGMKALSILPMAHVYEFTIGQLLPLMMGVEITFLGRQPAPSIVMSALKDVRPHVMLSVPLLIEKVYRSALLPLISGNGRFARLMGNPITRPIVHRLIGFILKRKFGGRIVFFGIGGAPLDRETEDFLHAIHFPYALGYGLTETSPLIAGCRPRYREQKPGYIGRIVSDDEVILLDIDGSGIGEIAVKGPNVMKGYYGRPDLNEDAFTENGFFRTGDLGCLDSEGRLAIKGRVKNMILGPGGENIYPEAIESILNNQEYVDESLVIPENGGLVALVRLNLEKMQKEMGLSLEQLKAAASDYLAKLRKEANSRLAAFSKLTGIREQETPFERTPTLKIKRYLYDGGCSG